VYFCSGGKYIKKVTHTDVVIYLNTLKKKLKNVTFLSRTQRCKEKPLLVDSTSTSVTFLFDPVPHNGLKKRVLSRKSLLRHPAFFMFTVPPQFPRTPFYAVTHSTSTPVGACRNISSFSTVSSLNGCHAKKSYIFVTRTKKGQKSGKKNLYIYCHHVP